MSTTTSAPARRRRPASPVPPAPRSARTRSRLREADAQHRLSRIQVHNWGTFNGYHDLPVPRDGLILTGPSGSGKSSLLDALSAVLVPAKNRRFNAAAQDSGSTDRARTILSYVRGAYRRTTDGATGEVVTDFLRTGATRSGIALTFSQGGEGAESLTLIVLFHVRAGTNAGDAVAQLLLMAEGSPDLTGLLPYLAHGIDRRAIRRDHPEGMRLFDKYEAFAAAFRRRLGLSSEVAQRLLHRTQAAKSLTSLDTLLRDFMLDEPETLRLADAAVEQFGELREAHAAVVQAREQERALAPLSELSRTIIDAGAQQAHAEALAAAVPGYVHHLRLTRLEEERDRAAAAVTGLEAEVAQAAAREDSAVADLDLLRAERHGAAGAELPAATARLEAAQAEAARRTDAARALERCLSELDATAPTDARAHHELQAVLEAEESSLRGRLASLRAERDTVGLAALDLKRRIDALTTEREQILASRSAMPARLLGARDLIATVIGQPASVLPFAGEILRVVDGEEDWRVAIEAVAGGFATHMLVPDRLYRDVLAAVDTLHLGARLHFDRLLPAGQAARGIPRVLGGALARKIEPVPGSEHADWLNAELMRRFDHLCVDGAEELAAVDRGVTRAGQVKSSRTAHLKDDRRDLADPRAWVIGVDVRDRLELVVDELAARTREKAEADARLDGLEAGEAVLRDRLAACQRAAEYTWEQIDTATATARVEEWAGRCERLRAAQPGLVQLDARIETARQALARARESLRALSASLAREAENRDAATAELDRLREREQALRAGAVTPGDEEEALILSAPESGPMRAELDERFRSQRRRRPNLEEISEVAARVSKEIVEQREAAARREARAVAGAVVTMSTFVATWPETRGQVLPEIDYLEEFLAILARLQSDDLPRHERRFAALLRSQSRQNIGHLASEIRRAVSQVRARIGPVNDALATTEYSPGHHLRIKVEERRLPVVNDFLRDLATIASGSLELDDESPDRAEERYALLGRIMSRLGSSEPRDAAWRRQCLDTRLHVAFRAEERNVDGVVVDVYEGASGLSGGQRQKLVVFCLAAALRYQLTDPGNQLPGYALVVLDEAFDKTDADFTRAGLEVFRGFGFQLLLATPMKMLQTLEEHVGGAAMVTNTPEGDASALSMVLFDADSLPRRGAWADPEQTGDLFEGFNLEAL